MRKTGKVVAVAAATIVATGLSVGTAAAGPKPAPKTTGSVTLSGSQPNSQYLSYDAFQTSPVKGSVNYTNFDQPATGSGDWVPGTSFTMGFGVDPDPTVVATYAQSVTSWAPTSPTSVAFSGNGSTTGWLSSFTGTISGSSFNLSMTEINAADSNETYALSAVGVIASDGSVTGTWSDNYGTGRTGTFVIGSIGHEILHYVAPVSSVSVSGQDADFGFTIPVSDLAGTYVVMHVHDGGSPGAGNDTISWLGAAQTITSGNLSVFS